MASGVERWYRRRQGQRPVELVDLADPGWDAGLPGQLHGVIEHLHPVVLVQGEHVVAAEAADPDTGAAVEDVLDGEHHRAVVARPFEVRLAELAGLVDLDPVQAVLQSQEAAFGSDPAWVVRRLRSGVGGAQPSAGCRGRPAGDGLGAPERVADRLRVELDLADGLHPRSRVRAAQCHLPDGRVLYRGYVPLPHVEVEQQAVPIDGRQRRGARVIGLALVGHGPARDRAIGGFVRAGIRAQGQSPAGHVGDLEEARGLRSRAELDPLTGL